MTAKKAAKRKAVGKAKRIRRSPEEARALILDAAESCMGAEGPAALRLQDVAKKAGVSHPTILHHFGSREGLVRALIQRTMAALKDTVIANIGHGNEGVHATFRAEREGLAQRMLWALQFGEPAPTGPTSADAIAEALHAARVARAKPGAKLDIEESRFMVHLVAIASFGDALIGQRLRRKTGAKERAEGERFERWLGEMLVAYSRSKG